MTSVVSFIARRVKKGGKEIVGLEIKKDFPLP